MSKNEVVNDLDLPWCHAIEADPSWERIPATSLIVKPSTENALTAELLHHERGIRDMRTYIKYAVTDVNDSGKRNKIAREAQFIFSLGEGISGAVKRCQGGFISLMVDEVTGELAWRVFMGGSPTSTVLGILATTEMRVSYKRMIMLPAVVLCKAWITGGEGRKLQFGCSIEDGSGRVYATGEAVFVRLNRKL